MLRRAWEHYVCLVSGPTEAQGCLFLLSLHRSALASLTLVHDVAVGINPSLLDCRSILSRHPVLRTPSMCHSRAQ
ncbi:hypothetical protein BDN70DRAFT_556071 [Pholiota conissans]|uniref:Uncharacterized protein n=1 Tax=Pholiota conissans TaxID=109636 RepID=A0A9P5YPI7_9AGAR|nr:hypothetical protein BDN70DRAFT_556071 [Pholiota conissans]